MARTKMQKTANGQECSPQMAAAIWAAAQILAKTVSSADIQIGEHPLANLELVIKFDENGKITKFDGGWHVNTPSIPWKTVLALFTEKTGAVSEAVNRMLVECIRESTTTDADKRKLIEAKIKDLDAAEAAAQAGIIDQIPKTWRTGRTTADANPTIVLRIAESEEEVFPPAAIKPSKKEK